MKSRDELAAVLQHVTHDAHAAFADGWGLAVMYRLAQQKPRLSMDIAWGGATRHYERVAPTVMPAGA
ncbi:MAG: hypothetical protein JOZ62_18995 [Acidobacteriaceae bacterium]|nr:hypothetical protein [Acidobacteriaceae bacterium]